MTNQTGPITFARTAVATIAAPSSPAVYVAAVQRLQRRYATAFERLATLDRAPRPEDAAWSAAFHSELGGLLLLDSAARDLTPPAALAPVHRAFVQAAQCFAATAALALHELAATGGTRSEEAVAAMRDGIRCMDEANDLLAAHRCG